MKKAVLIVLTNVATVVGLLLLIEGAVRVFVPQIGPIGTDKSLIDHLVFAGRGGLARNASGTNNGALVRTTKRRIISYEKPYDSSLNSILFVGDSVTMGLGVEPDSSFAGLLSASLDSVNILNTALIGYNATDYRAVADSFLNRRSPLKEDRKKIERVIIFWCLNDIYGDMPLPSVPGGLVRKLGSDALPLIRRHFMLYQFLKNAFFDRSQSYYQHDAFYYARVGRFYQYALRMIRELHEMCEEKGVAFEVVVMPYEYQLRRELPVDSLRAPQDLFITDLRAMDVTVFDAFEFMRNEAETPKEFYLYGDGIHFSKAGHRAFTRYVVDEVL